MQKLRYLLGYNMCRNPASIQGKYPQNIYVIPQYVKLYENLPTYD